MPWAILAFGLAPASARASFLPPELLDTAADWVAIFVLFFVPVVVIGVFWLVHILPEIIAEKRHHPQKATVNTLCLLSLVFGGMLWPLAWILAYTKPVGYRLAYGTDKHDDFFIEKAEAARAGKLSREEIEYLVRELDEMSVKRVLSIELMKVRDELAAAGGGGTTVGATGTGATATGAAGTGAAGSAS